MPDSLYCLDSLEVFKLIDENRVQTKINSIPAKTIAEDENFQPNNSQSTDLMSEITGETSINWQLLNETTPQSKTGIGFATHLSKANISFLHPFKMFYFFNTSNDYLEILTTSRIQAKTFR